MSRAKSFSFGVFTDAHVTAFDGVTDSPFNVNSLSNYRYAAAIQMINKFNLDFALNLGDMNHPLPQSPDYRLAAKRYHEITNDLNCNHYCIPGNHDIGDKPSKWVPAAEISSKSLEIYESQFGADYKAFSHKGWRFILLNAELFNSQLSKNSTQKEWFVKELENAEQGRTFVSLHYPPFLCSPHEIDHYDNIGNADRIWFLNKIKKYNVTAVLSGHVHNFWLNRYHDTELLIVPSTSFVRQDYSEMYGVQPLSEGGRDDANKLGFMKIDVREKNFTWKFYRTFAGKNQKHASNPVSHSPDEYRNPSFGVDCRIPWITYHEIPPSGALDEFYRKEVRNDYPLLGLYELGINRLRLPLNDLIEPKTKQRLREIKTLGFEYTFYCLSTDTQRLLNTDPHALNLIDKLELIWDGENKDEFHETHKEIKKSLSSKILISPMWKDFGSVDHQGRHLHVIKHGFSVNNLAKAKDFFTASSANSSLWNHVDGIVCEIDIMKADNADWKEIDQWGQENNMLLHVLAKSRPMSPADIITDETMFCEELGNLWARAKSISDKTTFFTDSFIEVDRGYFQRSGIIDRLGNPLQTWHKLMNAK